MNLALTNPVGHYGLAAIPLVFLLYLFYRRYASLELTGLFLWGSMPRQTDGGRRLDSPFRDRALWLDLVAAAALALALAGPVLRTGERPVVVVMDNSFGMRARGNHEQAVSTTRDVLSGSARGAVILTGGSPVVLSPLSPLARNVQVVSEHYRADGRDDSPEAALSFAIDLYGLDAAYHVITNRKPPATASGPGGRATWHILAGHGENLAFEHAWRRPDADDPSRDNVVAYIRNWSGRNRDIAVMLHGTPADRIGLAPGTAGFVEFTVPATPETLVLVLADGEEDVIPEDSRLFLPPPGRRQPTFTIAGGAAELERFVRPALIAARAVPARAGDVGDILVTSGWQADSDGGGRVGTLAFVEPAAPGIPSPPYLVHAGDSLTRELRLDRLVWTAATGDVRAYPVGEQLVSAGDLPLIWRDDDERLVLNADPAGTGLFYQPAWPILIGNFVQEVTANLPGVRRRSVRPGETVRSIPASDADGPVRLYHGDEPVTTVLSPGGRGGLIAPREPGLYTLRDGRGVAIPLSVMPSFGAAGDTTVLAARQETIRVLGSGRHAEWNGDGTFRLEWLALVLAAVPLAGNWRRRREGC